MRAHKFLQLIQMRLCKQTSESQYHLEKLYIIVITETRLFIYNLSTASTDNNNVKPVLEIEAATTISCIHLTVLKWVLLLIIYCDINHRSYRDWSWLISRQLGRVYKQFISLAGIMFSNHIIMQNVYCMRGNGSVHKTVKSSSSHCFIFFQSTNTIEYRILNSSSILLPSKQSLSHILIHCKY